jgi:hypothetical protein
MAEEKTSEKPEGQGGIGQAKPETENLEVSGRGRRRALYTCFRDGAQNYVDPSWNWFMCWQCSGLTYLN